MTGAPAGGGAPVRGAGVAGVFRVRLQGAREAADTGGVPPGVSGGAHPVPSPVRSSVKTSQRFDYSRLAELLAERGLVEPHALREALQLSSRGNLPFAEALVGSNLVADWELSRLVCELYGLPFLTVEMIEPDARALEGLDASFLIEHGLVPVSRHGRVLTVLMPALVRAEVLAALGQQSGLTVLPAVGTVATNRRWLETRFQPETAPVLPSTEPEARVEATGEGDGSWSNLFDAADAAVLLDLKHLPIDPSEAG